MKIVTRKDATAQGLKRYFSGRPCKEGHTSQRCVKTRRCIECLQERSKKEPARAANSRWYAKNKDRIRDKKFIAAYGISLADFLELERVQNGVCAICEQSCPTGRELCVDHDHKTGKVRGLLCHYCNTGLGKFRDDPNMLETAIRYLLRHNLTFEGSVADTIHRAEPIPLTNFGVGAGLLH